MKKYYLFDHDHDSLAIRQDRIYRTAALIVLKYGNAGNIGLGYTNERIREFWTYNDDYPSVQYLRDNVKCSVVKWYLHHKTVVDEKIWSSDFLRGLMTHCKILWNSRTFPSCYWRYNTDITNLIESCPFGGDLYSPENPDLHRWGSVPALYLKFDESSMAFMAGAMAGLRYVRIDDIDYAMFRARSLPYFKKWGIPIEKKVWGYDYLISPLWPALFVDYMPLGFTHKWLSLKNPCNADIYGPILWKTYVNNDFGVDAIPYLKSRRAIYYAFECEEGAMRRLDRMRVEKNLTELDNRIKTIVKEWSENERD